MHTVPTQIVDKNGKLTTVHKKSGTDSTSTERVSSLTPKSSGNYSDKAVRQMSSLLNDAINLAEDQKGDYIGALEASYSDFEGALDDSAESKAMLGRFQEAIDLTEGRKGDYLVALDDSRDELTKALLS